MYIRISSILICACLLASSCNKEDSTIDGTDNGDNIVNPGAPGTDPVIPDWPEDQCGKDYIWNKDIISEIKICVDLKIWNILLEECDKNTDITSFVRCNVVYDNGHERDSILNAGLRLRDNRDLIKADINVRPEGESGNEHQADPKQWNMSNFEIDFDKIVPGSTLRKVDAIQLKSCRNDPSYAREMFCSNLLKKFGIWTAARNGYCRLSIHVSGDPAPVYLGVYLMKEVVNSSYLEDRKTKFMSSKGFLWKCGTGATLKTYNQSITGKNDADSYAFCLQNNHQNLSAARRQLENFIRNLNTLTGIKFREWIKSTCDIELLLNTYAASVTVGMWNDYWNMGRNYYLYFNTSIENKYKVYFIPDNFEHSLGNTSYKHIIDAGTQDPYRWGTAGNPLIKKILEVPEFKKTYTDALKKLCTEGHRLFDMEYGPNEIAGLMYSVSFYTHNDLDKQTAVKDLPASWSSNKSYTLRDAYDNDNFFKVRSETIMAAVAQEESSISSQHN